jgi:transcriptional regulator with XRE-family HTH domain
MEKPLVEVYAQTCAYTTHTDGVAVGQRFSAVRKLLRLTQQQFADSLNISLRSVQNYEKGERKIPSRALLELARTHGIDPLWVLDGPGERPRPIAAVRLDPKVLVRAEELVGEAMKESGRTLTSEQRGALVSDAYHFLLTSEETSEFKRSLTTALKMAD